MPRSLIIRSGRSPFQVLMMGACLISGVAGLVPHEPVGLIDRLGPVGAVAWYSGLILGAAVVLGGQTLRLPTSILVERVGQLLLGGLFLGYGTAIYLVFGLEQVRIGGVITIACGVACGVRVWEIGHDLQRLSRALATPVNFADDGPHLADPDDRAVP